MLNLVLNISDHIATYLVLYSNNAEFSTFVSKGIPKVNISSEGICLIGENFRMNNRELSNPIGRFHRCSIIVSGEGQLTIGNNVGMSSTGLVCHHKIVIGDNVRIGGNVVIYDTDFHSLNAEDRLNLQKDQLHTKKAPVIIQDNVFVGAHSTILKGVTVGENSVIGACSVVTKDVPPNEIWAGNPAKFLKTTQNTL